MKKPQWVPLAVLAAVPFVMVLGNSMLIPVLPEMQRVMDLNPFRVGLIITAFSIPAGLVIPFSGAFSDHVGRRVIIAPALLLYGTGGLIAGAAAALMANPYSVVLVGRVIQGIGAGGTFQLAMALTGDMVTGSERPKALGLLEAANGLGKVVSPIAGAAAALILWYIPFFVYGILAFPIALAVWFLIKEPTDKLSKRSLKEYLTNLQGIVKKKAVPLLAAYALGMAGLFILFGVLSYLSDVLEQQFSIRGFGKGLVLAIPVTAMATTSYLSGLFLQGKTDLLRPLALAGMTGVAMSMAVAPFTTALVPFMIVVSVLGIGVGLVLPSLNTMITGATDAEERGIVTSFYGTVRFFGVALGPPAFGLALEISRSTMFFGAAGIGAAALAFAWFFMSAQTLVGGGKNSPPPKKKQTPVQSDMNADQKDELENEPLRV